MKSNDPATWTQTEIVINRGDYTLKDPTIMAAGAGGSILTRRVTNGLFVADDVVQDDEAESEAARRKLRNWFFGVLMNVREPEDQGVVIGTRKHDADLYSELVQNPEFTTRAYDAIAEEDEDGAWHRSLWPAKWPVESLLHRQKEIGTIQFDKNYRNRVLGDANSKFPMKWFDGGEGKFRGCFALNGHIVDTHWTDEVRKVIAVDLASGQSEASAYFVALVVALDDRGDFHILNMVGIGFRFPIKSGPSSSSTIAFTPRQSSSKATPINRRWWTRSRRRRRECRCCRT